MNNIVDQKSAASDGKTKGGCEINGVPEQKPKPCCACPETRRNRDECIVAKGQENCQDLIKAHRECMAKYGYII